MTFPNKKPVVGVPISMTSYADVLSDLSARPSDKATVVAVCNVHSVMSARRDRALFAAISSAEIATPDGVPIVWGMKWLGQSRQERVYGPELMKRAMIDAAGHGWKHYLYGSTPETLTALQTAIAEMAPGAQVVGAFSPPFREMTADETESSLQAIRSSEADLVWIGLGMPKQELWMHEVRSELPGVAVLGVGAAFDFLAGTKKQAPAWIQKAGLEWLFRLAQEPRRLWRRYVWNNPAYVGLLAWQILRSRVKRS